MTNWVLRTSSGNYICQAEPGPGRLSEHIEQALRFRTENEASLFNLEVLERRSSADHITAEAVRMASVL